MAIQEAIEALRLDYISAGADKVAADATKVAQAQDMAAASATKLAGASEGVVAAEQKTQRVRQSTETQLMRLQRQVDAQMRKQMELARMEGVLHRSVAEGLITEQRRIELVKLATQHLDRQTVAVNRAAAAGRGLAASNDNTRFATANLAAQFQDIAVTAQMGMSPIQIALQQGTQLSAVLNTMQSPLRGLAGALASVINPVSLLTIGFVALGAAAMQWFMSAKDGSKDAETALEGHRKWLDELLQGYADIAKAARAAGDAARSLPQGVLDLELSRGGVALEIEGRRIQRSILDARRQVTDLLSELAGPAASMSFGLDRNQLGSLREQLAALRDIVLTAGSSRQQLEDAAVAAGRLFDSADDQSVKDAADALYQLTMRVIEFNARVDEVDAAKAMRSYEEFERRMGGGVADAIERVEKQMVDLRTEKQRLDDAFRTDAMGARTLSEIYALAEAYDRLNASLAARDAKQHAEELKGVLDDLGRRAREVTYAGLSDRHAATNRILDEFEERAAAMKRLGATEDDLARNTRVMNEAIRQSAAHFDELERKAGEKGAARAIKEVDREMERFIARSNQLLDSFFPGEAALREARELEALLARFGGHLDHIQRAAVEMRIADMFTAASLGVRELDRDSKSTQATMGKLVDLAVQFGQTMGAAFAEPLREGERFFDRIARLIGDLGRMLMETFKFDWKKFLGLEGGANTATLASQIANSIPRSVPAVYSGPSPSSPAGGARAASGLQSYERTLTAVESGIRYVNQGATRNQQLSARLTSALEPALAKFGLVAEVFSGGQPGIGSGGARVGSTRHDHGNAADIYLSQGGVRLNWSRADQRGVIQDFISEVVRYGVTGIGAGPGYMGEGAMHVGFGAPGVWGAGGRAANAPRWLRDAYAAGLNDNLRTLPQAAPVPTAAPAQMQVAAGGATAPSGAAGTANTVLAGLGAMAAGFSSGYQSQNPLMGAISGGLGAIGTGNPAAIGLGILGGLIGGIVGLKKAIEDAREELRKIGPEIKTFVSAGLGAGVSEMAVSMRDYARQAEEYMALARKARDFDLVSELQGAVDGMMRQLVGDFRMRFEGALESLGAGAGLNSEFLAAQDAVLTLREELKGFVADAEWVFGPGSAQVGRARATAQEMLLSTLGSVEPLSAVGQRMEELGGTASVLRQSLMQLGMSGEEAAAEIRSRLVRTIEEMRDAALTDTAGSVLRLAGKGHLTEIVAAQERYNERLSDFARQGLDGALAMDELVLSLSRAANGAEMSRDEFAAFGVAVGLSGDVIARTSEMIAVATEAQASRYADLSLRLLQASVDTSTLEGQLKVFDRQRVIEINRMKLAKATAEELALAEQALGFERQNLISQHYLTRVRDAKATLDQVFASIIAGIRSLRDYRTSLLTGDLSPLSGLDQLRVSQQEFFRLAQAAMSGDRVAFDKLPAAATTFLEHARAYYASTEAYAGIFATVQQTLAEVEQAAIDDLVYAARQVELMGLTVQGLDRINGAIIELTSGTYQVDSAIVGLTSIVAQDGSIVTLTGTVGTGLSAVGATIMTFGDTLGGAVGTVSERVLGAAELSALATGNAAAATAAAVGLAAEGISGAIGGTNVSLAALIATTAGNGAAAADLNSFVARDGTVLTLRDAVAGLDGKVATDASTLSVRDAVGQLQGAVDAYLGNGGTFSGIAAGAEAAANAATASASALMTALLNDSINDGINVANIASAASAQVAAAAAQSNAAAQMATAAMVVGGSAAAIADALLAKPAVSGGTTTTATKGPFYAFTPEGQAEIARAKEAHGIQSIAHNAKTGQWDITYNRTENFFQRTADWLSDLFGFSSGGWTGNGGVGDVAGLVHGREYVVPAPFAEQYRAPLADLSAGRGWTGPTAGNDNSAELRQIITTLQTELRALREVIARGANEEIRADREGTAELRSELRGVSTTIERAANRPNRNSVIKVA